MAASFIEVHAGDHVEGPADAPITLVEYGDFECPQCGHAFAIVQRVRKRMRGRMRFVFRHFPITSAHPHAQRAAETAEWAAGEGAFWRMHDRLYTHQQSLDDQSLLAHARALGLDPAGLQRAWSAHSTIAHIKEDFLGGIRLGVTGTPAFFVNGVQHAGGWDEAALTDAALAASPIGL